MSVNEQNLDGQTTEPKVEEVKVEETTTAPEAVSTPEGNTEVEPEAYTPSFKYKVMDQEKEIDEYFRKFIKDKEAEEKFRDIFTKADGLEIVKKDRDTYKEKYAQESQGLQQTTSVLQNLKKSLDNGYMEDFFEAWGINDEKLFQHVLNRLKLQENPELKHHYDQSLKVRRENMSIESEREALAKEKQELISQNYKMELDYNISRPEVQQFAQQFETLPGRKQGDFIQEVLKHGLFVHNTTGKDIPISQAINETIQSYQFFINNKQPQPQVAAQPKIVTQSQVVKPMPNISGQTNTSPTHKKIRSIEDLENLARDMEQGK